MSNKTDQLDVLSRLMVEELIHKIRNGEATAADLSVARAVLKDNGVQFGDQKAEPIKSLTESLPFTSPNEGLSH